MPERSGYGRRELLAGLGAVVTGGVVGRLVRERGLRTPAERDVEAASETITGVRDSATRAPPVVTERDEATLFPLVTYNDRTGEYDVTMPVNVRFDLTDSAYGLSDVQSVIGIGDGWTQVAAAIGAHWPTKDAKPAEVWSRESGRLVPPVGNYRKPINPLGPRIGYHLYLWPVQSDGDLVGVAAQAHTDIGTVIGHIGGEFDEAAATVSSVFAAAGWRVTSADFDYGITLGDLDLWGATGDRVILPPRT